MVEDRRSKGIRIMLRAWMLTMVVVGLVALGCGGNKEWVTPSSGGEPCMCSAVCTCQGMSPGDESANERKRCWDACDCPKCPGSETSAPPQ
jgi:hypothetical protein